MAEVNKDDLIARYREALDLIWHVAPLPTQTERERLERIHGIVKIVLSHTYDPWQPIDTAPKEQPVIVWCDGAIGEAYYDDDHGDWWWANTSRDDYLSSKISPTLWRPVPAPPRFDGRTEADPVIPYDK